MTVGELIEKLQDLDPNLRVFTRGYEGGYDDVCVSEERSMALNVNTEWYYGKHDNVTESLPKSIKEYKVVKGIVL